MASRASKTGHSPEPGEPTVHISATTHDQATTHQVGQDQYITTNNYYGAAASEPPSNEAVDSSAGANGGSGGWFAAHRSAWIGAVATIVAALIGVTAALSMPEGDNSPDGKEKASRAVSRKPAEENTDTTPSDPGSVSPTPTVQPTGTVQWEGTLLLATGGKDLDAPQPVSTDRDEDNDFYVVSGAGDATIYAQADGATVSLWEDSSKLPDFSDCSSTVNAAGADDQSLEGDSVMCVKTGEGRIGRLKVTSLDDLDTKVKFDAVVWNLASDSATATG